ncbi:MAG TPA: hypothetical protein VMB85_20355 [Bryobacteraceae bacterium]|jgi:hypothetical protein|nr:hypothetical protein [Bryobacteraceae bacterium]
MHPLRGSFSVLVLYDLAEQIDLERLRATLGSKPPRREPTFKHPAPEYVRFERPPVVEDLDPVVISTGEQFLSRVKYFAYGVISVELELPFDTGWDELVRLSSRFIAAQEIEKITLELVRGCVARVSPALGQIYPSWLSEDYYIINLREACDPQGQPFSAEALLAAHGEDLARIVRGESGPLSPAERADALQSSLSYYPTDLLLVGWLAALVYDTPQGAAPAVQLLEYANTQLLEYRHYDDLLTRILENVYKNVERRGGPFRHWRMAREAAKLNAFRLEVTDLTERTDNAIKFISDMFYARAYRMAAARVGVTDYRNLVERKLRIAADLYQSMVAEYYQARSFLLEVVVVAILAIELIQLFRGTL